MLIFDLFHTMLFSAKVQKVLSKAERFWPTPVEILVDSSRVIQEFWSIRASQQ